MSSITIVNKPGTDAMASVSTTTNAANLDWGRRRNANYLTGLKALTMMLACPILILRLSDSIESYDGSIWTALRAPAILDLQKNLYSKPAQNMHLAIAIYMLVQAVLYKYLPGSYHSGQLTPAGNLLEYKTNGLLALAVTLGLFAAAEMSGLVRASFIAAHWAPLLSALNVWGLAVTLAVYLKARLAPTHHQDRVFSGNMFYDIFMGVELNPRLEFLGDIKLFINGRTGMMAWPLVILSHAAFQYETHGFVSKSMLVVLALQFIYVVDFFWNEHWYLQTIDVAHDHVGFYLAWGCMAWLPMTYTLQSQFLARAPGSLSDEAAIRIFLIGVAGYAMFRSSNNQKYRVRNSQGQCAIWGKPATFIAGHYKTSDGKTRTSLLLTNGWWGMARHVNYLGDLVLSFSMCAACGTTHILPWFYAIYMSILLLHRCYRDEVRCAKKYGSHWRAYCDRVPWRIVPFLF